MFDERTFRLVPTRANGQPAFGVYVPDPHATVFHAGGLVVATLAGSAVSALTSARSCALLVINSVHLP